jgi:hypothetical protein
VSFKSLHLFNEKRQGQYLAGLIEGNGHFTEDTCRISFNQLDRVAMENSTVCFTKNAMSQVEAMAYGISFNDSKVARQGELILSFATMLSKTYCVVFMAILWVILKFAKLPSISLTIGWV